MANKAPPQRRPAPQAKPPVRTASLRASTTASFTNETIKVDRDNGIIFDVAFFTAVEASGHGFFLDPIAIKMLVDMLNAQPGGLKNRFSHPDVKTVMLPDGRQINAEGDSTGSTVGRAKNAYLTADGNQGRGDIHLGSYAKNMPGRGNLWEYLLDHAAEDPQNIGLSIVFDYDPLVLTDRYGMPIGTVARPVNLYSIDWVERGAVNPNGLLSEKSSLPQPHEYSTTQVNLPDKIAGSLKAFAKTIPDDHLDEEGREADPHVTVRYGLDTNDHEDARKALMTHRGVNRNASVKLGNLSYFPATPERNSDVLHLQVESPDLQELHQRLGTVPHVDKQKHYQPHATVAYLKPGMGAKYAGKTIPGVSGKSFSTGTVEFGSKDRSKHQININPSKADLSVKMFDPQTPSGGPVAPGWVEPIPGLSELRMGYLRSLATGPKHLGDFARNFTGRLEQMRVNADWLVIHDLAEKTGQGCWKATPKGHMLLARQ